MPGKQTDWGCWVGIVTKAEALEIFKDTRDEAMIAFLKTLVEDQSYAVVAREG